MHVDPVLSHIDRNIEHYVEELVDLVRIPSISAGADDPRAAATAIQQAASFLVNRLSGLGLDAYTVQVGTSTHPLVLAHPPVLDPDRPAVVIYGHYDVQGVDNPRSAWSYDPFGGERRDGFLLGRGASDDKGQLMTHICAWEALGAQGVKPLLNPIFLIEGEEERGSQACAQFVATGGLDRFGPILCSVVSDSSMFGPDRPALTVGLRGIAFTELTLTGPRQDLHSGVFGGVVPNPNNVLVHALDELTDREGRITVPGFYEGIRPLEARERERYAELTVDEEAFRRDAGITELMREPGFSLLEQCWTRPTLDIHFLAGGSPRTVIPARTRAALSCRLVPDQNPQAILTAIQDQLRTHVPPGYHLEFERTDTCPAYHLDFDHALIPPALDALRSGFGSEPVLIREGGSIPIVLDLAAATEAPVLLLGFGQRTDNWHGPDERFSLRDFHRGIRTAAALMVELSSRR